MKPWHMPGSFLKGVALTNGVTNPEAPQEEGYLPEGIPTEKEFLQLYFQRRGVPIVSDKEWQFWKVLISSPGSYYAWCLCPGITREC